MEQQSKYFGDVTPGSREPRTREATLQEDGSWKYFNLDLGKWVAVDVSILRDTEAEASTDARRMAGFKDP